MAVRYSFSNDECLTSSNRSERNSFVIENYDKASTFSSFLPGIAGVDGTPMWSFYVNRGQAMGSFGIRDKNGAIMEFFPANVMYMNIEHHGFRTFIRKNGAIHEIFSSISADDTVRRLFIEKNLISIEEENRTLGLRVTVTYFTLPGETFAALVRKVTIERLKDNRDANGVNGGGAIDGICGKGNSDSVNSVDNCNDGSNTDYLEIELLDGLPQILPYGIGNTDYQAMSNLARSWFGVYNLENKIAYYKVRGTFADTTEVRETHAGNFYLSFSSAGKGLISPIFDMNVIFGENTALTKPDGWDTGAEQLHKKRQVPENKVSGGFTGVRIVIPGDGQIDSRFTLCTMIGYVADPELINSRKDDFTLEYIDKKQEEARKLVENLVEDVFTKTANPVFDQYIEQCYLDNFLRGGYPLIFKPDGQESARSSGNDGKNVVYHVFSRKHGDIEREYNFFSLEPSCYSQGNGNFRDVNQNRRNDVLIKPEVTDFNVKHLMSLIQVDGYNPLVVKGCTFTLDQDDRDELMKLVLTKKEEVGSLLSAKFTPGALITFIREQKAGLVTDEKDFLGKVLASSHQEFEAEFGEGYWSDHWTYNLDLIETYLAIYPDKKQEFLFGDNTYRFFYSPVFVLPRADKYVLVNGKVRQYGAVLHIQSAQGEKSSWLKTGHGSGSIYETNLFAKLISLALNKFIALDPYGMGIEMEADRPGWNDAMNGLPGLFGSGLSETVELKRVVDFLIECCMQYDTEIAVYVEAVDLMREVEQILNKNLTEETGDFVYWDRVSALKEKYRSAIITGIDGKEVQLSTKEVLRTLKKFAIKLQIGLEKALSLGNGIYPTYFTYEALEYKVIEGKTSPVNGYPNVVITGFGCKPLPLFLEAPARMLKSMWHPGTAATAGISTEPDTATEQDKATEPDTAIELYAAVKASAIYDRKLKMYKTSVPLGNTSFEAGRLMAFTPGWLEREAIFMHMEYKYLYAMLKAGLYEEFYKDIGTMLVPYMRPEIYGRSILENSSFIASSVNPDESQHGRGFVARMSGTTAEMLTIWFMMMAGTKVFEAKDGELTLSLAPILSGEMFDREGKVSFKFLGKVLVTYHNPLRAATYGEQAVRPHRYVLMTFENGSVEIGGSSIRAPYAQMVRDGRIARIEVHLSPEQRSV